jgi:hypothetical protein
MDVDAALAEVPVNLLPLTDDTDFKTRETGIGYNQAGMDLVWNFVTTAGAMTQTAVTPTTAGDYDWAHQGDGMYSIEIPASGGASINNDTEGFGWFTGYCTGVLPWRGPVIAFRAAAINNALIDGGDNLDVNTVQWLGTACATPTVAGVPEVDMTHMAGGTQTVTDLKDFADAGYDPATNKVQGVVLVDTTTTNTDMVSEPPTANAIADQVWDEAKSGHVGAGSFGEEVQLHSLSSEISNLNNLSAAEVNSEVDNALLDYDAPTKAEMDSAFTEIKGATWSSATDTIEHIRNKQTDTETTLENHLTDIKGTGFVKDTNSLPQCLTATGFSTHDAAAVRTAMEATGSDLDYLIKALVNKLSITESNHNTEMFDDAGASLGSVAAAFETDGTYTNRKRMVI